MSATLFDRQYDYNDANQISQIVEPNLTRDFQYDDVNRLETVTASNSANESYTYDDVGNRTNSHWFDTYSYSANNRTTSASSTLNGTINYSYNANGNTISKAEGSDFWLDNWDHENRLVTASKRRERVNYQYDALGRRTKTSGFIRGVTKYTYDGLDVIQDDDSATGITKYQNGIGIDNKLRMENGSDVKYFLADQVGSTNGLVNTSGNLTSSASYDSFGNTTGNLATRYQFTGREKDDVTGLYYFRARWYDSKLGRFTTEDPIGFGGKQINLYGYLGNNPLLASDPLGLYPDKPVNYLRDPVSHDSFYNFGGLTNGISNTVSDVLALDYIAQLGWTIGDYRCSTNDRVKAGVSLGAIVATEAFGGAVVSKGLGLAGKGLSKIGKFGKRGKKLKECALCFETGTDVETKDGAKPIEKIDTDDEVLSYNEFTGELEYQPVIAKISRYADDIYSLKVEGESKPLGVTSEHPFYIKTHKARDGLSSDDDGEWEETRNLEVGDEIKLSSGKWAKILSIEFKGEGQVYNFTVANNHNYFVGDLKLLTHNNCSQTGLDVIDETTNYSGRNPNFSSVHKLDADDALAAGEDYLGSGYSELGKPNSGVFRSADGLRGFRIDKGSISGSHSPNVPHAHFEKFSPSNLRKSSANNHVEIFNY